MQQVNCKTIRIRRCGKVRKLLYEKHGIEGSGVYPKA